MRRLRSLPHGSMVLAALMAGALAALGAIIPAQARAQSAWKPERPVTIVVPYSPGGGTDALARYVAKELQKQWKQSVLVENQPGADGLIGTRRVIDAKPDGYTLLVQLPSLTMNSHLPGFKGTDPVLQLIPISVFAKLAGVIVSNAQIPGKTMADVVSYCKTAAQPCSFGTTENIARLYGQMLGEDIPSMVVINYKGGGQLITDLIGNSVNMALMGYTAVMPYQKSGKLNVLMSLGPTRSPVLPDVPSAVEAGFGQMLGETWYGLFAPLGTPQAIIDAVAEAVREATRDEGYVKSISTLGASPVGDTPVEFAELVRQEGARFAELVRRYPIK
jgi:tripartite-type tricarboxylate transporter receptor subunit TctC